MRESVSQGLLKLVGTWEGFDVVGASAEAGDGDVFGPPAPRLMLVLQPKADHPKRCSQCGAIVDKIHDVTRRENRDKLSVDAGDAMVWRVSVRSMMPGRTPTTARS